MDPTEQLQLWWTLSMKGSDRREGFRAGEIITVLNLWNHCQLVTADTRLKVIRPQRSFLLLCHVLSFLQEDYHIPFPLIGEVRSMLVWNPDKTPFIEII